MAALLVALIDLEHPPAAGTAPTAIIDGFGVELVIGILAGVALLALAHRLLKPVLKDLV